MSSSSRNKCAVCNRSFGMMLWKHSCDVCHHTVCDDCAPRNVESVDAKGEGTKLRVCKSCGTSGRRLGSGNDGEPTAVPQVDPNSEEERRRRAAAVEARNKSQQSRGRPQGAPQRLSPQAPSTSTPPPATTTTTAAAAAPAVASPAAPVQEAAPAPASSNAASAARPSNPALEAALRRQQQQQQARGGSAANAAAANMSPEKVRLLREIDALLASHREEPPFGLRASDETKLKGYLQYLKSKYHVAE